MKCLSATIRVTCRCASSPASTIRWADLWVDYDQRTNIPGLLAAGECDYSIHGANRLGANSLVSCVFGGFVAAPAAIEYATNVERNGADGSRIYDQEMKKQQEINDALIKQSGKRKPVRASSGDGQSG